jgi:hypothetical protein
MGVKKQIGLINTEQRGDLTKGASLVSVVPNGVGFGISAISGTLAAALAAGASVFAMRLDPGAGVVAYIDRIRIQYTTIVAYTTPLTAGRRLAVFRGSGANATVGTAIAAAVPKHTSFGSPSEFNTAQGGDMRISATAALTVTGITFEADPIVTMPLVHVGNAGNYAESIFEFSASESAELVLEPGQLLAVRCPQAMDAAGTWQLGVNVQWREAPAYGS